MKLEKFEVVPWTPLSKIALGLYLLGQLKTATEVSMRDPRKTEEQKEKLAEEVAEIDSEADRLGSYFDNKYV